MVALLAVLRPDVSLACKPFIAFYGGFGDQINGLLKPIAAEWRQRHKQKGWKIKYYPWHDEFLWEKRSIADIRNHWSSTNNKTPIILIGHSYGGDTAYTIAEELPKEYNPTLVTLDAVGRRAYWSNPGGLKFRFQISNLRSPTRGVWINVRVKNSNYGLGFNILAPPNPTLALVMMRTLGQCDFVARTGGPYGFQKNATKRLVMGSKFDHCDVKDMLATSGIEDLIVEHALCQN